MGRLGFASVGLGILGEGPGDEVVVTYEDGATFSFPASDVVLLPIVHSSVEELAGYVLGELRAELPDLDRRGVRALEVGVAEAPGQIAYCCQEL